MRTRAPLTWPRLLGWLAVWLAVWALSAWVALSVGTSRPPSLQGLLELFDPAARQVIVVARLPRVWFASIVGAALAVSGAVFQAVLRNPLADPYVLGVSGGAALGGTLAVALGLGAAGPTPGALVGAMGALGLLLMVQRWLPDARGGTYVLLLTGVVFNAFASSIITFVKATISAQKAQELLFYLMGSLAVEGVPVTEAAGATLLIGACVLGCIASARALDLLTLGDDEAEALGVHAARVRLRVVVLASVAVAVAVAYAGMVGFVGLLVPHGLRLLLGADHRLLLPACALGGAAFLTLSDAGARACFWLLQTTLPVGVITACVGAPLFMLALRSALGGPEARA